VLVFFAQPRPAPKVFPGLTDREPEVLALLAQGHPNPSIARRLSLSPKTVADYVSATFAELQEDTGRRATARTGRPVAVSDECAARRRPPTLAR
jgi:DNA-binding NarL/FixJ family response regulator